MPAKKGCIPWNAGTSKGWVDKRGYRWVYVIENGKKRARRENRVVVENHLKRTLEPWELVHHINGDTADNSIANLQVMEFGAHTQLHQTGTRRDGDTKRTMEAFALLRETLRHERKIKSELLEALKSVLKHFVRKESYPNETNDHFIELATVETQARQAIAKATGKGEK